MNSMNTEAWRSIQHEGLLTDQVVKTSGVVGQGLGEVVGRPGGFATLSGSAGVIYSPFPFSETNAAFVAKNPATVIRLLQTFYSAQDPFKFQ